MRIESTKEKEDRLAYDLQYKQQRLYTRRPQEIQGSQRRPIVPTLEQKIFQTRHTPSISIIDNLRSIQNVPSTIKYIQNPRSV
jgi:hypothetical protein